jgi:hypothetical protein
VLNIHGEELLQKRDLIVHDYGIGLLNSNELSLRDV